MAETLPEAQAREAGWGPAVREGVQNALVWSGDYQGRLDGVFGSGTRAAIQRFQHRHGYPASGWLSQEEIALLEQERVEAVRAVGWRLRRFSAVGIEVGIPEALVDEPVAEDGALQLSPARGSGVVVGLWVFGSATPAEFADFAMGFADDPELREDRYYATGDAWMVSSGISDGVKIYIHAINTKHGVKAFSLAYPASMAGLLNRVAVAMFNSLEAFSGATVASRPANRARDAERESPDAAGAEAITGSGFYVNHEGVVLSNAHVAGACGSIVVDGSLPARLIASDENSDLAAILVEGAGRAHLRFRLEPARLNEDVTVVGYPLRGLLGSINVTRGAVSSLAGLGGSIHHLQVSAPVQPGNSGGPVVDASGAVIGVVQSKLDAALVAALTGDIPQNVNFAINGSVAQAFLAAYGIPFQREAEGAPLSPPELAEQVRRATVLIECRP